MVLAACKLEVDDCGACPLWPAHNWIDEDSDERRDRPCSLLGALKGALETRPFPTRLEALRVQV